LVIGKLVIGHWLIDSFLFAWAQRLVSANYRAVRRAIRRELGPLTGLRVVDLGCGTGNLAGEFSRARYVGVDVDLACVRFARRVTGFPFAVTDVTAPGLRDDAFDAAIAVGLIHHLDDGSAKQFACQVRRFCRDGARVLVVDIVRPRRWNLPERARQRWAERGHFIRTPDVCQALFVPYLAVERTYPLRSGFLEYQVLVLRVEK
jgi:SAM-dependent methyltransferase